MAWNVRIWGHQDDVGLDEEGGKGGCRFFLLCPWVPTICSACGDLGDILDLQACTSVSVGAEDKNVVTHLGSILSGIWKGHPFVQVKDWDVLQCVSDFLRFRSIVPFVRSKDTPRKTWLHVVGCR